MERPLDSETERVLAALDKVWEIYEAAGMEYFQCFTADASFFSPSLPVRLDGREAYRREFGPYLGAQRRASHVLHPEVRLLPGGAALVTGHSRIRVNYNSVDHRLTLLLVPDGDELKIAHMHMSPMVTPAATATAGLVEEITSLPAPAPPPSGSGPTS